MQVAQGEDENTLQTAFVIKKSIPEGYINAEQESGYLISIYFFDNLQTR